MCCRYDYENCESGPANKMMENLNNFVADSSHIGQDYSSGEKTYQLVKADNFCYTDPVDNSVSKNQVRYIIPGTYNLKNSSDRELSRHGIWIEY